MTDQQFALTTIVTRARWMASGGDVLSKGRAVLADQLQRLGVLVQGLPHEDVDVIDATARVRVTLSVTAA
jgi:hypothetical protein